MENQNHNLNCHPNPLLDATLNILLYQWKPMPYYAVASGHNTGVFKSWVECERQVKGYSGAKFKKFKSLAEAEQFIVQAQVLKQEPVETACSSSKGNTKGSFSKACASTKMGAKKLEDIRASKENVKEEVTEKSVIPVKKGPFECPDYISLSSADESIKEEYNDDNLNTSQWFEDKEGDEDLLVALSALQEYPDKVPETEMKKNLPATNQRNYSKSTLRRVKIGSFQFHVDDEDFVQVYIGGYCENIGSWDCMAGFGVYFGDKHPLNASEAATGRITRNVGDIQAALHAIKTAMDVGIKKICIHTNSEFLLKAVTSWLYFWKTNGWHTNKGKVVQNRKELEKLNDLLNDDNIDIKWHDVTGDRDAAKAMREVRKLASIGKEEYLMLHPTKDLDGSLDCDFDFPFF